MSDWSISLKSRACRSARRCRRRCSSTSRHVDTRSGACRLRPRPKVWAVTDTQSSAVGGGGERLDPAGRFSSTSPGSKVMNRVGQRRPGTWSISVQHFAACPPRGSWGKLRIDLHHVDGRVEHKPAERLARSCRGATPRAITMKNRLYGLA